MKKSKKTQEIEDKLNKEYQKIGTIKIEGVTESILKLSEIEYVSSIMENIEPNDSSEPIIVSREYFKFKLIDGYHRYKFCQINNTNINAIIVEEFEIQRKADTLLQFMQDMVGETIFFLDDDIFEIDGKKYFIQRNEGCGGCDSGWSDIQVLPEMFNKKIKIKNVESKNEDEDLYDLYINRELIAKVNTGYGNGCYGGDFEIQTLI
jgi:hypothetical protein